MMVSGKNLVVNLKQRLTTNRLGTTETPTKSEGVVATVVSVINYLFFKSPSSSLSSTCLDPNPVAHAFDSPPMTLVEFLPVQISPPGWWW